jgi:hypothetical protein
MWILDDYLIYMETRPHPQGPREALKMKGGGAGVKGYLEE